ILYSIKTRTQILQKAMNIKYHFFLFLSIIITSCGPAEPKKKVDEGKVEANIYTSAELGWSIKIPNGWKITDLDETQKRSKKGLELIEKTFDTQVDSSGLKNLISFQKNNLNIFQSTTEPFVEEHEGEWEESNNSVKQLIYETYVNQGMNVDSSVTQAETIDGVKFNTFTYRI